MSPHGLRLATSGAPRSSDGTFTPVLRVNVRHGYFNGQDYRCPDLLIAPTAATARIMRSLGLLYLRDESGFAVLMDERFKPRLLSYVAAQAARADGDGRGYWTRLAFMVAVEDPRFVNFTAMPLDTPPLARTFYLSNVSAQRADPEGPGGTRLGIVHAGPLTPPHERNLTGSQYSLAVRNPDVISVVVRSVGGVDVIDHCVYGGKDKDKDEDGRWSPPCNDRPPDSPGAAVYLNLAPFPEGKYLVREMGALGRLVSEREVVYANLTPSPMMFLDLALAPPEGVASGLYPILRGSGGPTGVAPTEYRIELESRKTFWNYYVASTGAPLPPEGLFVLDASLPHPKPIGFSGPVRCRLLDGTPALRFRSDAPLPFEERPTRHFRLARWLRDDPSQDRTLVSRLPSASPSLINKKEDTPGIICDMMPLSASPVLEQSDIYVYV